MRLNISAYSIRRPIPSVVLFMVLVALGIMSFRTLAVTRLPNVDVPLVSVAVPQFGAAPSEIENQVTKVVENAVAYEARLAEMARWRPDAAEKLREAAELADRHYRLGAVPLATYVELQKQYLEAVEAILDTKRDALQAAQELEILTGLSLYKTGTGDLGGSAKAYDSANH